MRDAIADHMRNPLENDAVLKRKLDYMGVEVGAWPSGPYSPSLYELVPTEDATEEIREILGDSFLSNHFMKHAIVDKQSEEEIGFLLSSVDGSSPSKAVFVKDEDDGSNLYVLSPSDNRVYRGKELLRSKREVNACGAGFAIVSGVGAEFLCSLNPVTRTVNTVVKKLAKSNKMLRKYTCGGAAGAAAYFIGEWSCDKVNAWLRRFS